MAKIRLTVSAPPIIHNGVKSLREVPCHVKYRLEPTSIASTNNTYNVIEFLFRSTSFQEIRNKLCISLSSIKSKDATNETLSYHLFLHGTERKIAHFTCPLFSFKCKLFIALFIYNDILKISKYRIA